MCYSVKLEDYSYSTFKAMSYLKDFYMSGNLLFLVGFYWLLIFVLTYVLLYSCYKEIFYLI